jgi:hypothetical protein
MSFTSHLSKNNVECYCLFNLPLEIGYNIIMNWVAITVFENFPQITALMSQPEKLLL